MTRALPALAATALVIACGLAHGRLTGRWAPAPAVGEAAARLPAVPKAFGDWRGEDLPPLSAGDLARAGFAGYVSRAYVHGPTGASVTLLLACGRPGALAVHTPDLCYPGSGYEPTGPESPAEVAAPGEPGGAAGFREITFSAPGPAAGPAVRVLWSWSDGGAWRAPGNPRLAFALAPCLYKLYLVRGPSGGPAGDAADAFLKDLLPGLRAAALAAAGAAPSR